MTIHKVEWKQELPPDCREAVVTFGNFDGVHLGHAALLASLVKLGRAQHARAIVVTFEPHPRELLQNIPTPTVLTSFAERADLLRELGANKVVVLKLDHDFLKLSAAEFFDQIIRSNFAAKGIVEGYNFAFGRGREGTVATLTSFCQEASVSLEIVSPVKIDGTEVSSSRIRTHLLDGEIAEANILLGRRYRLRGKVVTGEKRGSKLGFPTANLADLTSLCPGNGVYTGQVELEGSRFAAAINIGPNPTFGQSDRKVEVHVIDFRGDLYGRELAVDFSRRVRQPQLFSSVPELVKQLLRDVEQAKADFRQSFTVEK